MKLGKITEKEIKEAFDNIVAQYDNRAIVMTVILLIILFLGFTRFIVPGFNNVSQKLNVIIEKKKNVDILNKKIKAEEEKIKAGIGKKKRLPITIYETPYKNFELEVASSEMISKIIETLNKNGNNKITTLEFEKKELKDNIGVVSKEHSVLVLKIEIVSSYDNLQTILNDLYALEYLVQVKTLTLLALKEYDYKRVNVYLELDLPVKTS